MLVSPKRSRFQPKGDRIKGRLGDTTYVRVVVGCSRTKVWCPHVFLIGETGGENGLLNLKLTSHSGKKTGKEMLVTMTSRLCKILQGQAV